MDEKRVEQAIDEPIWVKPLKGTESLTIRSLLVFRAIKRELGDKRGRVDYQKIADELGLVWNNVKYAVNALVKAGVIEKEDGELRVVKKLVV